MSASYVKATIADGIDQNHDKSILMMTVPAKIVHALIVEHG